jgi:putative RecB family exonuclease
MKKQEAEGLEMLELFTYGIEQGKISAQPFENEKEFKLPFANEIVVVGKIDRIDLDDDGEYIVTDYKSGAREPNAWFLDHDLQFTTYAWACKEMYGKLPKELRWHHLRNGKQLVTHRTDDDITQLLQMLQNALDMNRQNIRYRVFHSQVCNWCEFSGPVCDDKELEAQLLADREEVLNGN